jgi:hypothetical protein
LALEVQERHVDDAVAHVDRRADLQILAGDLLELEHLRIEFGRLVEVLHDNGDVAQTGHDVLLKLCCRHHNSSFAARATLVRAMP